MSRLLSTLGIVITVSYMAALWWFFDGRLGEIKAMQPNNIGDFLAGIFGPLAIAWLILGFFQQGIELRQNTRALELQAQELKNSVEQQSQLVAVSREQMQQEVRALEDERERRRDAARPKIVPQHSSTVRSGSITEYKIKLVNVGNTATKLRARFDPPLIGLTHHNQAIFPNGEVISLSFQIGSEPSVATINYIDADGLPGEVRFSLAVDSGSLLIGEIERVL